MNKKKSWVLSFKKFGIEYLLTGSPTFDFDSFSTLTYILSDFCLFFFFWKKMNIRRRRTISTKIVLVTCYPLCILKSFDTRSHWDIFFHCGVIYQWWKFFVGIEHFCLFKLKFGCDAILFLLVSKTLRVLDVVQLTAVCGTRAAKKV
jgi:hypothetical protein